MHLFLKTSLNFIKNHIPDGSIHEKKSPTYTTINPSHGIRRDYFGNSLEHDLLPHFVRTGYRCTFDSCHIIWDYRGDITKCNQRCVILVDYKWKRLFSVIYYVIDSNFIPDYFGYIGSFFSVFCLCVHQCDDNPVRHMVFDKICPGPNRLNSLIRHSCTQLTTNHRRLKKYPGHRPGYSLSTVNW